MKRVLHITNIPTPYRIPQLNEMNRQFAAAGWKFMVAFGARGYSRRKWEVNLSECQFDYRVLRSTVQWGRSTVFLYGGLSRMLQTFAPDVVVVTGFSLATMKLWLWSLVRETRYVIFSGSIQRDGRGESRWRRWQRKLLVERASGGVAYGSKAKEYLVALGMPEESVCIGINTVDTRYFQATTERLRGLCTADDRKVLTYVGYLNARKNVGRLLKAIACLAEKRCDFLLEIIGDGEERGGLEEFVTSRQLSDLVVFEGYRQKEELPAFLAHSSCFLFQTDFDIWGLVLNEAMAAGLPCLASVHAGATADLIEDGVTGFVIDFADVDGVAERISWVLDHPEAAAAMGRRASRYVNKHANLRRSAAGFVEAVQQAWQNKGQGGVYAL